MQVRSDRRHRFEVAPDQLWAALTRTEDYRRWWPWLRHLDGTFRAGERLDCVVQPPLPYRLRFAIELDEVVAPRYVTASITGDLEGHAAIDLRALAEGTELRLVSVLSPTGNVVRSVARVAEPAVRLGHDWVLAAGVRQFRQRAL